MKFNMQRAVPEQCQIRICRTRICIAFLIPLRSNNHKDPSFRDRVNPSPDYSKESELVARVKNGQVLETEFCTQSAL